MYRILGLHHIVYISISLSLDMIRLVDLSSNKLFLTCIMYIAIANNKVKQNLIFMSI